MSDTMQYVSLRMPAAMLTAIRERNPNVSAFVRQAVQRELEPVTAADVNAAIRVLAAWGIAAQEGVRRTARQTAAKSDADGPLGRGCSIAEEG